MLELFAEPFALLACASALFFLAASVSIKQMCPPKVAETRRFIAIAWAVGFPPAMIIYSAALLVGARVAAPCNGESFTASVLALWFLPAIPLASAVVGAIIRSPRVGIAHFAASAAIVAILCWRFDRYSSGLIDPAFVMTIAWTVLSLLTFLLWSLFGTRQQPGVCVKCNYDLRGLRDPKCPECGTLITPCAPRYCFHALVASITRTPPEFMAMLLRQERLMQIVAMSIAAAVFAVSPALAAEMANARNSLANTLLQVAFQQVAFGASLFLATRISERALRLRSWVWIVLAANAVGFIVWTAPLTALNWFGPCNIPGGYLPNARSIDLFGPIWPFVAWLGPMTLVAACVARLTLKSSAAIAACLAATSMSIVVIYVYPGESFRPLAIYAVAVWHLVTGLAFGILGIRAAYRQHIAHHACTTCSYDLHGLADGKCPECGTPIPSCESTDHTLDAPTPRT